MTSCRREKRRGILSQLIIWHAVNPLDLWYFSFNSRPLILIMHSALQKVCLHRKDSTLFFVAIFYFHYKFSALLTTSSNECIKTRKNINQNSDSSLLWILIMKRITYVYIYISIPSIHKWRLIVNMTDIMSFPFMSKHPHAGKTCTKFMKGLCSFKHDNVIGTNNVHKTVHIFEMFFLLIKWIEYVYVFMKNITRYINWK